MELMIYLQSPRLTSTSHSDRFEFNVVPFNGPVWDKHCFEHVGSERASRYVYRKAQDLTRSTSTFCWYTTVFRIGLGYDPAFPGLKNMKESVHAKVSEAEIFDKQEIAESSSVIHARTLDLVLQFLTVATCQGIYRDLQTLFLPTFIAEMYVGDLKGRESNSLLLQSKSLKLYKGSRMDLLMVMKWISF